MALDYTIMALDYATIPYYKRAGTEGESKILLYQEWLLDLLIL